MLRDRFPASHPLVAALLALSIAATLLLAAASPAHANAYVEDLRRSTPEQRACLVSFGYSSCRHAQDAHDWSKSVTMWRFGYQGHNDIADAFRHCAAAGALATRVGENRAKRIGQLHEDYVPNNDYERLMDIGNNAIGARIGRQAVDARLADTWGHVLWTCDNRARSGQLLGYGGIRGNY